MLGLYYAIRLSPRVKKRLATLFTPSPSRVGHPGDPYTRLLIATSTSSRNLPVRDPTFQLPIRILIGSASFLTLRTRREKCEDPCSFLLHPGVDVARHSGDDPTLAHLSSYPGHDTTRPWGDDDPVLAHLSPHPGSDVARRQEGYAPT